MDAIYIESVAACALGIGFVMGALTRGWIMTARNENLRKLQRINVVLVDYHRWLGHEFPEVERVLENLFIEFNSRPIGGGEDVSSFRSVSNLREELRKMRIAGSAVPSDVAE